jgi:hypothetical protein
MFSIPKNVNVEELRRLAESDVPVLAFAFKRRAAEDWAPEHSHARGQFFALTRGLLVVEAGCERWMFPSQRCAWIPPDCMHKARSVGGVAGSMVYLSAEMCRGLPKKPCLFSSTRGVVVEAARYVCRMQSTPRSSAAERYGAIYNVVN